MALAWALATNIESGLRIVTLPWPSWNAHGNLREMGDWLAQLLERYPTVNTLHAQALAIYSYCLYGQSTFAEAIRMALVHETLT
jgi:hypothetical protein